MLTKDQLESEVLSLSRPERADLVHVLVSSLASDPEVERAWDVEVRRRIRDIDRGVTELIAGEDVFKEVEDLLQR